MVQGSFMRLSLFASIISLMVFCAHTAGQASRLPGLKLRFAPAWNGTELKPGSDLSDDEGRHITMLRCYISGIRLWLGDKEVWREQNSYHLLDTENPGSLKLSLELPRTLHYNTISFNLGVDSAASCSGAHSGDLDPVKGMYWAWQSGYINFKLEGVSPQSTARKHEFHFHLGGYQYPYASMQTITLQVKPSQEIVVRMDLSKFLSGIDLSKQNSIMIPGAEAAALSRKAATIFEIQ
jgi:hypothetical protein